MREKYEQILEKLSEIELDFQENKGIILTECDLQCLLFHKIYELFAHNQETFNPQIKGSPLHSEIKFFNENGKLFYQPDITIINPDSYSIIHSIEDFTIKDDRIKYKPTSSKEFEFGGDAIIIELKFCRTKNGITKVGSFKDDLRKIKKIKKLVERNSQSKVYGIVAIFNKTDYISEEFDKFIKSHSANSDILVKYYTGKLIP